MKTTCMVAFLFLFGNSKAQPAAGPQPDKEGSLVKWLTLSEAAEKKQDCTPALSHRFLYRLVWVVQGDDEKQLCQS